MKSVIKIMKQEIDVWIGEAQTDGILTAALIMPSEKWRVSSDCDQTQRITRSIKIAKGRTINNLKDQKERQWRFKKCHTEADCPSSIVNAVLGVPSTWR